MPQFLIAVIFLVFVVAVVFGLVPSLRQIMRIRGTPTSPLGMLPSYGSVEAVGQTLSATGLSPIAAQPCALWQVEVQELRSSGKHSSWHTIYKQTSSAPFPIDDGTGQALVDPTGAELILNTDLQAQRGFFSSFSPEIVAALERIGISTTGFLGFQRTLRVIERHIIKGETLYVLGGVDPSQGTPIIRSAPNAPLIIADRSESTLLRGLYWRVAGWFLFAVVLGAIVVVLSSTR
jgi:hypothetical protein